jgi:hypothetical protein
MFAFVFNFRKKKEREREKKKEQQQQQQAHTRSIGSRPEAKKRRRKICVHNCQVSRVHELMF